MKISDHLQAVIDVFNEASEQMVEAIDRFDWENKEAYSLWLAQTYYMVSHTTRFLSLSAGKFDLFRKGFHEFSLAHLREERDHELLALKDLEELKMNIHQLPEMTESQIMIQCQYFWIDKNPVAHFGFFLCLEQLSTMRGPQLASRIVGKFGKGTAQFIELHAVEDIGHVKIILDQLKQIEPAEAELICKNMRQTAALYARMLDEIMMKVAMHGKSLKAA